MEQISRYADLMTVEDFMECCKMGAFIPDDGDGYYATASEMDQESSVWTGPPPPWATHVAWFNR